MNENVEIQQLCIDKSAWQLTQLGDLATEVSRRVDNPAQSEYERFVGLEHFVSGDLKIEKWGSTKNLASSMKVFEKGDILFARRNAYLRRASLVDFNGVCSGDAFVLKENPEKIIPGFLAFVVNSNKLWNFANSNAAGTMSKRVKWRDLEEYKFLLPPKDQQTKLTELLWASENRILKLNKVSESVGYARSVFFEDQMKNDESNRTLLKDNLIGIVAGKSPKGESRPANANEFGVLKVSAVGDGVYIELENKALVTQSDFNPKFEVKTKFILVTRANANLSGIGRPCYVQETRSGLMLSDKTLRLVPNPEIVRERFLFQVLLTGAYRKYVESVAGGTEAKNISQKLLGSAPAWTPPQHVQDKIEEKLKSFDQAELSARIHLQESKHLQKSLINQIF